jgi:hypothetical protein
MSIYFIAEPGGSLKIKSIEPPGCKVKPYNHPEGHERVLLNNLAPPPVRSRGWGKK